MHSFLRSLLALVLALVTGCNAPIGRPEPLGPLVVHGGTIYVGDGTERTVEALAVRDGFVVFAGDLAGAREAGGGEAPELNLEGATCVPGLQDAHGHILGLGASIEAIDLSGTESFEEVIERIAAFAEELPEGAWITGRGWDQTRWPNPEYPHHRELSQRVPDHPVLVARVDGHAALANELALTLAGLNGRLDPVPAVEGGRVLVDEGRRATGILIDTAMGLVESKVPALTAEDKRRRVLLAQERLLSEGLTCVHDMRLDLDDVDVFRALDAEGLLQLRVRGYVWGNDGLASSRYDELADDRGRERDRFRIAGVKLMMDGALGSRGAALLEPYQDAPTAVGQLRMEPPALEGLVARCAELGLPPAIHAIGDRANRVVLDAYARVGAKDPEFQALRPRVEHAQVVHPDDLGRFRSLGAIPSVQPRHATSDMRWAEDRLGPERVLGAYAWRTLESEETPLAFGSDFPAEPSAPLLGLYAARTRQDETGSPEGGWFGAQRMDGVGALAGFTSGAAYAVHEERERGRLLPGYYADMTLLDVDPVAGDPSALLRARVLATVIEGEVVFRDDAF